ncbi:hypothetical protein JCM11641_005258 [Rhodosporidiobolus odoratus]
MTPDNRSDLASTKENSRPSSPHLVAPQPIRTVWGGSKSGSKSGTPKGGSRAGTPSRVQQDPSVEFFKKSGMVNNLGLSDPREQDRSGFFPSFLPSSFTSDDPAF